MNPTEPSGYSGPDTPQQPVNSTQSTNVSAETQDHSKIAVSEAPVDPIVNNPVNHSVNSQSPLLNNAPNNTGVSPVAIVKVLSPRGVEYVFLTLALFTAAASLAGAIISLVNGQTSFNVLAYPTAALIVSVPVFALLFLRLKKAELNNPNLKLDPSKRRSTQFIQIVNFAICFFSLIGVLAGIFAKISGTLNTSIIKLVMDVLVVLVISGGILSYYWYDEHRS
jgi:hypothetical protein